MNLYISDISLTGSANNLDNARLRTQMLWLAHILSNILHINDLYHYSLDQAIKDTYRGTRRYNSWQQLLLPLKNEKHSTVAWAMQSPLYTLFILDFYEKCYILYADRGNYIAQTTVNNTYNLVCLWKDVLYAVLPKQNISKLYGLEADLYRNTPTEFDSEPDTIKAYQKYLIKHWKADIVQYEKLKLEQDAWKALSENKKAKIPKPRLNRKLVWSKGSWGGHTPDFAKDELNAFFKELKGVNEHARGTGTTG